MNEKTPKRKAVAVEPEIKQANLNRLRRIAGQVRGIERLVEEDRYCADIVMQISSVQQALRGVARNLLRNHLAHCATHALSSANAKTRDEMQQELLELMDLNLR
jgi:CsoR family transcriptional regulator, copper-sensing transcriptional repressor